MTARRRRRVRLLLCTSALIALAGLACTADAAPATVTAIATSTGITNVTAVPPVGTEVVLSATRPAASPTVPPLVFPALQFVENADCADVSRDPLPLADVTISDGTRMVSVVAEMAVSGADKSQGLMCREAVPGGTGMLFLWEDERSGGFWMFNTYVPLDILFFSGAAGDVSLIRMEPCPRKDGEETPVWRSRCGLDAAGYRPDAPYTTALELPQGWLESQGLDTASPGKIVVSLKARQ